jgi:hypothetical protein
MKNIILLFSLVIVLGFSSCKKNKDAHIPPDLELKTGGNYTSGNTTVMHGDSVLVGIVITKKEDDIKTLNFSYAYDGNSSTTTLMNVTMTAAEYGGYDHDFWIHTRNVAGTEKWIFTVTDRDGNLAQKSFTLTVQ